MFGRLKAWLGRLVDPVGPIGEVLSPSEVFKTRMGLPVSSPHSMRLELETSAQVEKALAPVRFVDASAKPPKNRVQTVSAFVEEVWSPVYAGTRSTNMADILAVGSQVIGWKIVQRARSAYCDCTTAHFAKDSEGMFRDQGCGRARKHLTAEQFAEVVQQQTIQASDEFYNGLYETIPGGTTPVMVDGEILRGTPTYDRDGKMTHDGIIRGTYISGGRAEYRQKTKGMAHWDPGFVKEREKAIAAEARQGVEGVKREVERLQGSALPMRRIVANPRRDRQSAV